MAKREEDKVLYLDQTPVDEPQAAPVKKKRWKKLKVFNILMLFLAAYFVFTIARQEFKLREIEAETVAAAEQLEELKQQEDIINRKIADAATSHMVQSKAKTILGWVGEGEVKVLAE